MGSPEAIVSREIIAQAQQLADKGLPRDGMDQLRELLKNDRERPAAVFALAWCYEKVGDFHTASYLYKISLEMQPGDENAIAGRVRCEKAIKAKYDELRRCKPRSGSILLSVILMALAAVIVLVSYMGFITELADALFDMDVQEYEIAFTLFGFVLAGIGFILLVIAIAKRIGYGKMLKEAKGEDFTDSRHIPCRVCALSYLKKHSICPYCKSPQMEPKPMPKPEEVRQETPHQPQPPPDLVPSTFPARSAETWPMPHKAPPPDLVTLALPEAPREGRTMFKQAPQPEFGLPPVSESPGEIPLTPFPVSPHTSDRQFVAQEPIPVASVRSDHAADLAGLSFDLPGSQGSAPLQSEPSIPAPATPALEPLRPTVPDQVSQEEYAGREWCARGKALEPQILLDVHYMSSGLVAPVHLITDTMGVEICLRKIPPGLLKSILGRNLAGLVVIPIQILMNCILLFINIFAFMAAFAGLFTGGVFFFTAVLWNFGVYAQNLLILSYNFILVSLETLKILLAISSRQPLTFVPRGMKADKDDVLARFTRGSQCQILRLDLTESFLKKKSKKKAGCCLVSLLSLVLLPLMIPIWILMRKASGVKENKTSQLAFVTGDPVDLAPPEGFMGKTKKKMAEKFKKYRREVWFVTVEPDQIEALQNRIEQTLGQKIVNINDEFAAKNIWYR